MQKKIIKPNIPGIIIACAMAASAFLPFISMGTLSSALIDGGGDGKYVVIAAAIGLIFAIIGLGAGMCTSGLIAGVIFYLDNGSLSERFNGNPLAAALVKKDIGWYLLIISAIAMFIVGIIAIIKKE